MKAILTTVFLGILAAALLLPLGTQAGQRAGTVGTAGWRRSRALRRLRRTPPPPQQKPQEAGASISVEVPVVTLDVIAATQHGDIADRAEERKLSRDR